MKFTEEDFYTLANFVGYGQIDAEVWFVVVNETLELGGDITARLDFEQVMDRSNAASALNKTINEFDRLNLNGEGIGISNLYLRLAKKPIHEAYAKKYLQDVLFTQTHNGLFCPFYPIPENEGLIAGFSDSFPLFDSYSKYRDKVKKLRLDFFKELIESSKPKLIVLLGIDQDNVYCDWFKDKKLDDRGFFQAGWDMDLVIIKTNSLTLLTLEQMGELSDFINENCLPIDMKKDFGPIKLSKAELEKQKKDAAKKVAFEKRKTTSKHNASDPYCVCETCLKYDR